MANGNVTKADLIQENARLQEIIANVQDVIESEDLEDEDNVDEIADVLDSADEDEEALA